MRLIERHYNGVMTDAINHQIVKLARPVARARQPSEQDSNPCLSTGIAFDRAIGLFRSHEARDRPFCPVAPSPCPGTAAAPAAMAADAPAPPDATLLSFRTALAYTGPPIEDGERCHVCNNPAVVEQLHIAWCPLCACTLFTRQQLRVLGPAAKACPSRHALEHAFRWTRIVGRLLAAASRPWSSPTVTLLSLLRNRGMCDEMLVPHLRHVSSPAAVSTGTPSLLRKVRASAASPFATQCETLSLLRKVMTVRKAAV